MENVRSDSQQHSDDGRGALAKAMAEAAVRMATAMSSVTEPESGGPEEEMKR